MSGDDPLIGSTLGGLRLTRLLGIGATASVYQAVAADGSLRAVKLLRPDAGAEGLRRQQREAEAGRLVTNPHVVAVYGSGEEGGRRYLVTEFVDGITLRAALDRTSPLPITEAVRIALHLLDGLKAVHAAGVVHRDVKPANILLAHGATGSIAKLADFGLALVPGAADAPAEGDRVVGTPAYLAPEQWDAPDGVDGRADLYSLGCTLFEALCSRKPFEGDNVHTLRFLHHGVNRPDPSQHRRLPEPLDLLLRQLLARDPAERPGNIAIVTECLEAVMANDGERESGTAVSAIPDEPRTELPTGVGPSPPPPITNLSAFPSPTTGGGGGFQLLGPYRLEREVWRDSFAVAFAARDTTLDVEVGILLLRTDFGHSEDIAPRFRLGARAGALIDHPNNLRVYSFHEDGGASYSVTEPFRGATLDVLLHKSGRLTVPDIFDFSDQILRGLRALHGAGFLHRDIKPHSLFIKVTDEGRVIKIMGFHLAKDQAEEMERTYEGAVMGTLAYIPPEVVSGRIRSADQRADLYSFGCVLFEMACGQPPFVGGVGDVTLRKVEGEAPDPMSFRRDLPPALVAIMRRLLRASPEERYPNAGAVLDDLKEARRCAEADDAQLTPQPKAPSPAPFPRFAERAYTPDCVVTHFPTPIALAYRRFCSEAEPRTRLDRLFAVAEAAVRYLVIVAVSDLFSSLADDKAPALPPHAAFDFLRSPKKLTLGLWAEALREAARALARRPGRIVAELPNVCAPDGDLMTRLLPALVTRRNAVAHPEGGIPPTPEECVHLAREARPPLEEFLSAIRFLCDCPLGFVQPGLAVERDGDGGGGLGYLLHSCMGAAVKNTEQAYYFKAAHPLPEGVPFVVAADGTRLLPLRPLLLQRVSPMSQRHTLYLFEDIPDRAGAFLAQVRHSAIDLREEWRQSLRPKAEADHAWLFAEFWESKLSCIVPAEAELHQRLLPWRGGGFTGLLCDGIRLHAPVGRGGFGTVYAGTTPQGESVAVKVFEATAAREREVRRFHQEFERLTTLPPHPGVVRPFRRGHLLLDGQVYPWYSMEFATGGDLGGRLEERRGLMAPWKDEAQRRRIAAEFAAVAAAVAHLHAHNVIHRDIKPSNILVMGDGSLRLSDFGLAKNLEPSERSLARGPVSSAGAVVGTRSYMAPEQEKGQPVGKPADVYALGILLAEMAAGDRPAANTGAAQGSTLQGWRKLNGLPEGLRRFVYRLTAVTQEERPADAAAVVAEFLAVNDSP